MKIDADEFLEIARPPLGEGDAEELARQVQRRWTPRALCELLGHPCADVRRVTAVTLGLVGDKTCVGCLARALHDDDAQVTEMAEHGLWAIWFRSCTPGAARPFRQGIEMIANESYPQAICKFELAARLDPCFSEAFNQCAIAHFFLEQWEQAIDDCQRTLQRTPAHFGALAGMGHAYAQLNNLPRALACYRQAVAVNPRLTTIARTADRLERRLADPAANEAVEDLQVGQRPR